MKKILNSIIILTVLLNINACSDYLDVVPDNIPTIDNAFDSRSVAERFLFTCYSYRPQIGSVTNDVAMAGSDEVWKRYLKDEWAGTRYLKNGNTIESIEGDLWGGDKSLWLGIRDCNIFLERVDDVFDLEEWEKQKWIAEVKFLKAYYHWQLAKRYGAIVIVDENLPIDSSPEAVRVYRDPFDDVVNYIVALLEESSLGLPKNSDLLQAQEAGRATKQIAMTTRAEVLLYAASPLFNGNSDYSSIIDNRGINLFSTQYDESKWKRAADACKEAIDMCHEDGFELHKIIDPLVSDADPVFQQQITYREAIVGNENKELIWGSTNTNSSDISRESSPRLIRLSPGNLNNIRTEFAPTLKAVEFYYSSNGVPINEDKDWASNNWYNDRYELRPEAATVEESKLIELGQKTANLHFNREPRFYASIGFDKGVYFGNGWYKFDASDRNVKWADFRNLGVGGFQAGAFYSITGYNPKKLHSFKDTQTTDGVFYNSYRFPIYRLADLYLMYAEALNEASGPSAEVYNFIDLVRERAGLQGVVTSWTNHSTSPGKVATKEGLRDIIHQERSIELAFEAKRFSDLRRWKRIDEMENPQGWNIRGKTNEEFYVVTPVAIKQLQLTTREYLWPINLDEVARNINLIQNYGW